MREVTDDPVDEDDDEDDYGERDGASGPLGEDEDYYGGDSQKEDGIVAEGFDQMSVRKAVQRAGGAAGRAVEAGESAEGAAGKIGLLPGWPVRRRQGLFSLVHPYVAV